jgi:hypothetical protein
MDHESALSSPHILIANRDRGEIALKWKKFGFMYHIINT